MDDAAKIMDKAFDAPIAYHRVFREITGSTVAAVFLSQCWYWSKRTKSNDGYFYKTQAEWEEETGLSRREQETARKVLKKREFIKEEKRGIPSKIHFFVDKNAIRESILGLEAKPNSDKVARNEHPTMADLKPNSDKVARNEHQVMYETSESCCADRASSDAQNEQAIQYTKNTSENTQSGSREESVFTESEQKLDRASKSASTSESKPIKKSSTTGKPIDDPEPEQSNVAKSGISPPNSATPPPLPAPAALAEKAPDLSARVIEIYRRRKPAAWADLSRMNSQRESALMRLARDGYTQDQICDAFEAALWFVSQDKWWSVQIKTFDDVLSNLVKWSEAGEALRKQKQPDRPDEEKAERLRKLREQAEINHAYSLFVERAKGAWMRKFYPPSPDDPDRARKGIFAWSKLSDWEKEDIYRQYRAYEHANHPRNPKNVNANSSSVAS